MRDAVILVGLEHAVSEFDRFIHLAVREHREKRAAEEFIVARVAAQRGPIIGSRRGRIALHRPHVGQPGSCRRSRRSGARRSLPPGVGLGLGNSRPRQADKGKPAAASQGRTPQTG